MIRNVSKIVLYDSRGFLVMQKRDHGIRAKNPDKIAFFGGGVEKGESSSFAALRELKEETNIKAKASDLTRIYSRFVWDRNELVRVHYYRLEFPVTTQELEVYEGAGFVLIDPKDFRRSRLLTPIARRVARKVQSQHYLK